MASSGSPHPAKAKQRANPKRSKSRSKVTLRKPAASAVAAKEKFVHRRFGKGEEALPIRHTPVRPCTRPELTQQTSDNLHLHSRPDRAIAQPTRTPMKKNFPLQAEGKHPERVLEAVKHEIRKYFKRERNRDVPKGADFWDFDCKVGMNAETAEVVRVSAVIEAVDAAAKAGATSVYVEILSKHGVRVLKAHDDHEGGEDHFGDLPNN